MPNYDTGGKCYDAVGGRKPARHIGVSPDRAERPPGPSTLYHNCKKIGASIGLPDARLHDLRHSFAVAPLRAGDDIKTVQGDLGHRAADFTLDVYGHITEEMEQTCADRMEQCIKAFPICKGKTAGNGHGKSPAAVAAQGFSRVFH